MSKSMHYYLLAKTTPHDYAEHDKFVGKHYKIVSLLPVQIRNIQFTHKFALLALSNTAQTDACLGVRPKT